jgi:hypothetical protein
MEVLVLGNVDIFIRSRYGVDLYFHLQMSGPLDGWQKVCFFLRNDTNVPLPMFMLAAQSSNPTGGMMSSNSQCEEG